MTCAKSLPPTAHPTQVGLVWRFAPLCSGLLGKNILRATQRQILFSSQKENCRSAGYTGTFPTPASTFTNHSFTKSTPETWGMTGPSSEFIQQSSHQSPLQNLHLQFPSPAEYCIDLAEREQWMGHSGTIMISSGVQQLPFPISKKVKHSLPLSWAETVSHLQHPSYQIPVFRRAHPFPCRGFTFTAWGAMAARDPEAKRTRATCYANNMRSAQEVGIQGGSSTSMLWSLAQCTTSRKRCDAYLRGKSFLWDNPVH